MKQVLTDSQTVAEIVTKFPKASDLFKTYRIDFCCGGNRPLIEAIQEKNLSVGEVLGKLNELYQQMFALSEATIDWEHSSSRELIEYIIQKHHAYLNEELPLLSPYITKVHRVHGATHPHLVTIHKLFYELKAELEQHTSKEETIDFPLILEFEENPTEQNRQKLLAVVQELEHEHTTAGTILKQMREITNDYTPPAGACGTYRLAYQRLEALESDLFQHIHLENNILFPRSVS
ncbi:iron-sulfur cluster repair di-iron protein [Bacillus sp. 2205SS5-2]|uniref:iron-sulfur cluster repair di-iron protein n=1 Tax=Bacillus sp. 2205SS5-2 TaxID=3109031 RepID=UPI00300753BD